jgi:hypothetical protein
MIVVWILAVKGRVLDSKYIPEGSYTHYYTTNAGFWIYSEVRTKRIF